MSDDGDPVPHAGTPGRGSWMHALNPLAEQYDFPVEYMFCGHGKVSPRFVFGARLVFACVLSLHLFYMWFISVIKSLRFSTIWTWILTMLLVILLLVHSVRRRHRAAVLHKAPFPSGPLPLSLKLVRLLISATLPSSFMVCAGFWTLLFPFDPKDTLRPFRFENTLIVHGVTGLFCLFELLLLRVPVPAVQVLPLFVYATTYLVFAKIFHAITGTYVYPIEDPMKAGTIGPYVDWIIYGLVFCLYVVSMRIARVRDAVGVRWSVRTEPVVDEQSGYVQVDEHSLVPGSDSVGEDGP